MNFIKNLFGLSLRSKVMKVIENKIKEAQKALDLEVKQLNTEISNRKFLLEDELKDKLTDLKFEKINRKDTIEEKHLSNILSKII